MSSAKYILIAKNTLQEFFIYRINFLFWRLQVFITFVIFYSLWFSIAQNKTSVGNYSVPQLYTYFVVGYITRALVFSTRTADIGGDIQQGNLSMLLIKPIGTIKYYFSRDIVDKLFNLFFMFFEFILIFIIFRPTIVFPNLISVLLFLVTILFSTILFFFYSLVISFITFWSDNAWPPRFLFGIVFVTLFSGQYLPLDFLPDNIRNLINLSPYPYMYFYPVKIWLGQLTFADSINIIITTIIMTTIFFLLANFMWLKGKTKYQSYGN